MASPSISESERLSAVNLGTRKDGVETRDRNARKKASYEKDIAKTEYEVSPVLYLKADAMENRGREEKKAC